MSFFKSLERKVLRPVGRGLKAAAPVIGGVAGSFIPGVGNVVGSALGSAIGGQLKKGKFDAGALVKDAGVGVLTGGVMNKLGGGSFLGGAKVDPMNALKPMDAASKVGVTGITKSMGNPMAFDDIAAGFAPQASGGFRAGLGNMLKDGKTIKAIGDTAIGGYNAVQQNRMMQMERDQMNRRNRIEDEEIARKQAMDPIRAQLLAAMFERLGMKMGAA